MRTFLNHRTIWFASHREVSRQYRFYHLLEVLKVVRFAQKVHWNELAHKSRTEFFRLLEFFDDFLAYFFDVNMGARPISHLYKNGSWDLHIEHVINAIAFFLHLCNFILKSFPDIIALYDRCYRTDNYGFWTAFTSFDFCFLFNPGLFYLLIVFLIIFLIFLFVNYLT